MKMRNLINLLNHYSYLDEIGEPEISDTEWDKLYFELKTMEQETGIIYPNSPTQMIYYDVKTELQKVEHNHPMLSLDKTKDWHEFVSYFGDHDVAGMLKLDGLTCSLRYLNGKLVSGETRGNGKIGEDITHNIRILPNVPQTIPFKGEYIADGEIICTKQDFQEFANEYANPRNFASGSIRLLNANECAKRKLKFIVWNVIKGTGTNDFLKELDAAQDMGFDVVPWTSSWDWDAKEFLINEAETYGYPIDGLVGRFIDIEYGESLGATDHHSKAAFAFKFEDEKYDTKLIDIDWSMGRTGQLTPVAIFEPTDTGDNIVERASLHNLSIMEEFLGAPYVGQPVKFYLANQIIPQLAAGGAADMIPDGAVPIEPPHWCPLCGGRTIVKTENNINYLYCDNPDCEGKLVNKLDHFLSKKGLDIKGISKATLEKLVDWGWVSNYSDLFNLDRYRDEWIRKPGFGAASVEKVLTALAPGREVSLENFIASLGIPLIGKAVSAEVVKEVDSYEDFRNKVNTNYNWMKIYNFAENKQQAIQNYDYTEADKVAKLLNIYKEETVEPVGDGLAGKVFVITGKLNQHKNREELMNKITAAGGKVVSSISKNVHYLINNDINSTSAKNVAAKKAGIPIISELDVLEMI